MNLFDALFGSNPVPSRKRLDPRPPTGLKMETLEDRSVPAIVGKVFKVNEEGMVEVEIADGFKVKVIKHTITQVLNKTEPAAS